MLAAGKSLVDRVGHLAGFATGITAASMIRQYDPKWGDLERNSFWKRDAKSMREMRHPRSLERKDTDITIAEPVNYRR